VAIGAFFDATIKRQVKPLSDAVINDVATLRYANKKRIISYDEGGDGFQHRVRSSGSTIGGATNDWGVRNFQTTQPFVTITGTYRQYSWPLIVSLFQQKRNDNAPSEAKMFKMVAEQLNEVKQQAEYRLGQHSYTGSAAATLTGDVSTPIDGLDDIVGSTTNTYMGIDRSVSANSYWRPQSRSVTKATADTGDIGVNDLINSMLQLFFDCQKGAQTGDSIPDTVQVQKERIDGIITGPDIFRAYQLSMMDKIRYQANAAADDAAPGAGSDEGVFMGMPLMWDNICSSTKMYFLCSKYLHIDCVHSQLIELPACGGDG
jgi:hypothetical protein